ncbi:hypothetical protein [Pedobacter jejuensis]|uniref:Uncharacterized protein n=1 Tax=Pedobacter jejuensis TaxID=1268550 RepID=A0A3N0C136_9SPHI|nr:hypothetical protein [Pedobacter jejuensis]RNL55915.1 hypothetical protein D7004_03950 [Pedobacter jejuensis]
MKTRIQVIIIICVNILLTINYTSLWSQTVKDSSADISIIKRNISIYNVIKQNNGTNLITRDLILNPKFITNLDLLSKNESEKTFPNIVADYILIITPKAGIKFLTLEQIFNRYKIDKKLWTYQILINNTETEDSKNLLSDETSISKLVVNEKRKYINIVTNLNKGSLEFKERAIKSKEEFLKKAKSLNLKDK